MDASTSGARWGTVAAAVLRRPGLSIAAKSVYATIATYADRQGWAWVRQETLAADLERSRSWVHAAVAELEGQGLVQHDRQYIEGRQRASRYRLLDGLARGKDLPAAASAGPDAAVQPADTTHHDGEQKDSPSRRADALEDEKLLAISQGGGEGSSTTPPADWTPSAADTAWALARHPDLDVLAFTEHFLLTCRAKGYRYADPSAAWRRWLLGPKGRLPLITEPTGETRLDRSAQDRDPSARCTGPRGGARANRRHAPQQTSGEARVAAWGRALARRQAARADADGRAG